MPYGNICALTIRWHGKCVVCNRLPPTCARIISRSIFMRNYSFAHEALTVWQCNVCQVVRSVTVTEKQLHEAIWFDKYARCSYRELLMWMEMRNWRVLKEFQTLLIRINWEFSSLLEINQITIWKPIFCRFSVDFSKGTSSGPEIFANNFFEQILNQTLFAWKQPSWQFKA